MCKFCNKIIYLTTANLYLFRFIVEFKVLQAFKIHLGRFSINFFGEKYPVLCPYSLWDEFWTSVWHAIFSARYCQLCFSRVYTLIDDENQPMCHFKIKYSLIAARYGKITWLITRTSGDSKLKKIIIKKLPIQCVVEPNHLYYLFVLLYSLHSWQIVLPIHDCKFYTLYIPTHTSCTICASISTPVISRIESQIRISITVTGQGSVTFIYARSTVLTSLSCCIRTVAC